MSTDRGPAPEPRDVDAEFARMLEGEGLTLRPGEAPREPAAPAGPEPADPEPAGTDSPAEPPSPESIARSRAAHPSAGARGPSDGDPAGPAMPRELDDDEVLYGDFEEPDPDLPTPSDGAMWSWTALLGGFVLMVVVAVIPSLPGPLGWLGGLAAIGGLVALLMHTPREHRGDREDGAEL